MSSSSVGHGMGLGPGHTHPHDREQMIVFLKTRFDPSKKSKSSEVYEELCEQEEIELALEFYEALCSEEVVAECNLSDRSVPLSSKDFFCLAEALRYNGNIRDLLLDGNQADAASARHLARSLQDNQFLEKLSLSNNILGDEGCGPLFLSLKRNHTLACLVLNAVGMTGASVSALAAGLQFNQGLAELFLDSNQLGNKLGPLFEALKGNRSLLVLSLQKNGIPDEGVDGLRDFLLANRTLLELDLCDNQLGDRAAAALADGLSQNEGLQKLIIRSNRIGDRGARALAQALRRNRTLEELSLGNNRFGEEGALELGAMLSINEGLQYVDLENIMVGRQGGKKFADMLRVNTTLRQLVLDVSTFGEEETASLRQALQENKTLEELVISGDLKAFPYPVLDSIKTVHFRLQSYDMSDLKDLSDSLGGSGTSPRPSHRSPLRKPLSDSASSSSLPSNQLPPSAATTGAGGMGSAAGQRGLQPGASGRAVASPQLENPSAVKSGGHPNSSSQGSSRTPQEGSPPSGGTGSSRVRQQDRETEPASERMLRETLEQTEADLYQARSRLQELEAKQASSTFSSLQDQEEMENQIEIERSKVSKLQARLLDNENRVAELEVRLERERTKGAELYKAMSEAQRLSATAKKQLEDEQKLSKLSNEIIVQERLRTQQLQEELAVSRETIRAYQERMEGFVAQMETRMLRQEDDTKTLQKSFAEEQKGVEERLEMMVLDRTQELQRELNQRLGNEVSRVIKRMDELEERMERMESVQRSSFDEVSMELNHLRDHLQSYITESRAARALLASREEVGQLEDDVVNLRGLVQSVRDQARQWRQEDAGRMQELEATLESEIERLSEEAKWAEEEGIKERVEQEKRQRDFVSNIEKNVEGRVRLQVDSDMKHLFNQIEGQLAGLESRITVSEKMFGRINKFMDSSKHFNPNSSLNLTGGAPGRSLLQDSHLGSTGRSGPGRRTPDTAGTTSAASSGDGRRSRNSAAAGQRDLHLPPPPSLLSLSTLSSSSPPPPPSASSLLPGQRRPRRAPPSSSQRGQRPPAAAPAATQATPGKAAVGDRHSRGGEVEELEEGNGDGDRDRDQHFAARLSKMETSLDSSQPINFLLLEALRNLNTEQTYGPAT